MDPCSERRVGGDIDDVSEKRHKEEGVADPVKDVPINRNNFLHNFLQNHYALYTRYQSGAIV